MTQPHEPPRKSRMLALIAVLVAGYAMLELLGIFGIPEWSSATKSHLTRAGIFAAYLGALTGVFSAHRRKPWLGKLAIAGVVVGSYLQILGAT